MVEEEFQIRSQKLGEWSVGVRNRERSFEELGSQVSVGYTKLERVKYHFHANLLSVRGVDDGGG